MKRALIALALVSSTAQAKQVDFQYHGFFADVDVGLSAPAADSTYLQFADPTFVVGIHTGWEFALHKMFLIAPELGLDIMPVNTDDGTFNAGGVHFNPTFTRVRFTVGARGSLRFGKAEPYLRLAVGVDYIGGHVVPPIGNSRDFNSTGFVFKPALGFQYEVAKYFVVGGEFAMPVAGHNFGNVGVYFNNLGPNVAFTAFDIELTVYGGFRY